MIAFAVKRAGGGWTVKHAWPEAVLRDVGKGGTEVKASIPECKAGVWTLQVISKKVEKECGRCRKIAPEAFQKAEKAFVSPLAKRK